MNTHSRFGVLKGVFEYHKGGIVIVFSVAFEEMIFFPDHRLHSGSQEENIMKHLKRQQYL